jgi:hypothetical protein
MIHFSEGFNGDKYASHFLDDRTRMNWVYTHSQKTQAAFLDIFKEFTAYIERQFGRKIKIFRIDGEASLGHRFDDWATEKGIDFETSTPYSPEQNGPAERSGGVMVLKSRCIRINASLPEEMWPEIIKASAYLVNRTPSKHLDWKSPIERLQISLGRAIIKPDIGHLKVYGCKTYAYIPEKIRERERHHKLAPRAKIGYLVGYESTNIYRIWFPQQEEVRPEKNVAFNEAVFFDPQEFGEPEEDIIVTMEVPTLPTTPPGGFISEDLEEDWGIRDSADPEALPSPPPSSSEPQKAVPALPAPGLPTPRATESPVPAPAAEPAPEPAVGPSAPSREIRGDVGDANIIEGR